jgi:hypothetical protein
MEHKRQGSCLVGPAPLFRLCRLILILSSPGLTERSSNHRTWIRTPRSTTRTGMSVGNGTIAIGQRILTRDALTRRTIDARRRSRDEGRSPVPIIRLSEAFRCSYR